MPKKQKPHLLFVEDNALLNNQITKALRKQFAVDQVTTVQGALNYLAETHFPYDIVLLDEHLPDGHGSELIHFIQHDTPSTKVCVFTCSTEEETRSMALIQGADAYLTKPLSLHCLHLHLAALLKRGSLHTQQNITFADLTFDTHKRCAIRQDTYVQLSQRESDFLRTFIRSVDGLVSREDLQQVYWKDGHSRITKSAIHVTIQRLRKKLLPLQVHIESIYGLGYRLTV